MFCDFVSTRFSFFVFFVATHGVDTAVSNEEPFGQFSRVRTFKSICQKKTEMLVCCKVHVIPYVQKLKTPKGSPGKRVKLRNDIDRECQQTTRCQNDASLRVSSGRILTTSLRLIFPLAPRDHACQRLSFHSPCVPSTPGMSGVH